jgi:hypothetical protein
VIVLDGPSGRTKHLSLEDPADPASHVSESARISGIQPPQFLEPTAVGYSTSNTSPILALFLSRLDELKGPDQKADAESPDTRRV